MAEEMGNVPLSAPDSIIAGLARDAAKILGTALAAHGVSVAANDSVQSALASLIAGILVAAFGMLLSVWNKQKVTKTIVAANQLPAAPAGTTPAQVVAEATVEVKRTEGEQP